MRYSVYPDLHLRVWRDHLPAYTDHSDTIHAVPNLTIQIFLPGTCNCCQSGTFVTYFDTYKTLVQTMSIIFAYKTVWGHLKFIINNNKHICSGYIQQILVVSHHKRCQIQKFCVFISTAVCRCPQSPKTYLLWISDIFSSFLLHLTGL